jgi:hypothetical protein
MFGWTTVNSTKDFPSLELPHHELERAQWLQHALKWLRDKIIIDKKTRGDGQTFGDRPHLFWTLVHDMIQHPDNFFVYDHYDMTTIQHAQQVATLVLSLQQNSPEDNVAQEGVC